MHPRHCSAAILATLLLSSTLYGQQNAEVITHSHSVVSAANHKVSRETAAGSSAALQFIPVTPCRIADTRNPTGAFGGPEMTAGQTREFNVPSSACSIPTSAVAYSLNVTVIPDTVLNYLTLWPSGETQPVVSTLNSDGRVKANAAIVPAGTSGGIDVFVYDQTQVILDIDGYFVPAGATSALAFYPVTPCRVADTRNPAAPLGGPFLSAGTPRDFPVLSSSCGIPSTAQAYSLNITAVPHTVLNYLTAWPAGEAQPTVSTLNATTGAVTANAAIVPAASDGDISVFTYNDADVILDVNGYFAPPGSGGLSLYTTNPCRILDTRSSSGTFSGRLGVSIETSACPSPAAAEAYVLNATVVPPGPLNYITLWPDTERQPLVSTLNAADGAITSNMAIVPTVNGSVDAYAFDATNLILDTTGYFAAAASTTVPAGTYAFVFAGTAPQGSPSTQSGVAMNGEFTVNGSGTITSGFYDQNTNSGPVAAEQPITGGSISDGGNGVGQLTLTSASGTATYALSFPASAAPGKDSAINIVRYDDTTGTGVRGSGMIKPSTVTAATGAIAGDYAFLLSGSNPSQVQEALIASFATDGAGNVTSGKADANQGGGQFVNFTTITPGTYTVDANGRGLLHLTLEGNTFSYSFYEVSPTELLSISVDPVSGNAPLVSGSILQQSGAPFSASSLPTTSVLQASGLAPGTGGGATVPDVAIGLAQSNGAGTVNYSFDEYAGTFTPGGTLSVNYAVDAPSGRTAVAGGATQEPILYIINSSSAFILFPGASSKSGLINQQAGTPFNNASINGNFLGGSLSLANTAVLNETGLFAADGAGNIVLTTDRSLPTGLTSNQTISGTYSVNSTGRAVVTTPDGATRILYVISPRKLAYLTSDSGGYLGSFQQ